MHFTASTIAILALAAGSQAAVPKKGEPPILNHKSVIPQGTGVSTGTHPIMTGTGGGNQTVTVTSACPSCPKSTVPVQVPSSTPGAAVSSAAAGAAASSAAGAAGAAGTPAAGAGAAGASGAAAAGASGAAGAAGPTSSPGFTPPTRLRDKWTFLIPVGKMGTLEDLIDAVTFLLSDASKYITGADLRVDGGYTLT
ncbi:D-arabinitol dehydrogenase ArbD [Penicillium riverlandense]|uniref:D-arabinitol dehydrogenase ArbD n=1 Tax=Penicillium riverlandense TaxID=1903569 RepID=UPI0025499211|nr:D-arabinitol dehydrogenase ArbD [Penicillium riverlandense]KAJ5818869.1 D-arabinitol dehydrogenase ArbD [Penicillium riverlandense]